MKLFFLTALLLPLATPAAAPTVDPAPGAHRAMPAPAGDPRCVPIPRQVAGEQREYRGTRLDQQPPGQLMLAVDRHVNGCHEATLIRHELRPQVRR